MIRRLIENDFPIREVSEESVREKNIRHGHISTLHIWWARRPLAASRTTAFAALVPDPETLVEPIPEYVEFILDTLPPAPNEKPNDWAGTKARKRLFKFTADLAPWEATRDEKLIEKARRIIQVGKAVLDGLRGEELREVIEGKRQVDPPKVLDPFAGGGSIPLEALRLGCEVYAMDYNPVAVLILKAVLEYPQKYGRPGSMDLSKVLPPPDDDVGAEVAGEPAPTDNIVGAASAATQGDGADGAGVGAKAPPTGRQTRRRGFSPDNGGRRGFSPDNAGRRGFGPDNGGRRGFSPDNGGRRGFSPDQSALGIDAETEESPLVVAVRAWGEWVLRQARKELEQFYPPDPDGSIPVGYIWARTLPCQNPSCGAEIPLMRQTWLARKPNKRIALRMIPRPRAKRVDFEIVNVGGASAPNRTVGGASAPTGAVGGPSAPTGTVGGASAPTGTVGGASAPTSAGSTASGVAAEAAPTFDPSVGTVSRANVRCPVCGNVIKAKDTRRLFQEGKAGQRMVAVVLHRPGQKGKFYRLATERDMEAYRAAERALEKKRQELWAEWGMDPVPDEHAPGTLGSNAMGDRYSFERFGDYFNARQCLSLVTFCERVRRAGAAIRAACPDAAEAVQVYLALVLSRAADFSASLCRWHPQWEFVPNTFSRQAIPMAWDYAELVPLSPVLTGTWASMLRQVCRALAGAVVSGSAGAVARGSAASLPHSHCTLDAAITDPPYYDNVKYSTLSDYFYVWLRRALGDVHQDLLATPLTPKSEEIVQDPYQPNGRKQGRAEFEQALTAALAELERVLRPSGVAVVVFAHKTTAAWEAVVAGLLRARLYLTASWPVHTEMEKRFTALETASLASSIYMVCRKRTSDEVGEYRQVQAEIRQRVRERLEHFWEQGVRGADFFMSAIGPAVEAFGKYARVEKMSGEEVSVQELLEYVRRVVSEFALERILKSSGLGGVDAETRFYLLWRWTYNHAWLIFDEARKLAQGVGVELTEMWGPGGLVEKKGDKVRVLGPQDRARALRDREAFPTMIDAVQKAVLLWESGDRRALQDHLGRTYGANEMFWQVAQAISEVLPEGDKERQLLQGLLYARRSIDTGPVQRRLIDE